MVLIHYKKSDHNQFLHQVSGNSLVRDVVAELVQINNMRIQIDIFACSVEDLATNGPLKPEQIRGLDMNDPQIIQNALIVADAEKKKWGIPRKPQGDQRFNQDKTQYRVGVIKNQHLTQMLIDCSNKAKALVSFKKADMKQFMNLKQLYQMKEELKAAVRIAYPNFEGLGTWEPARLITEDQFLFSELNTDQTDYLDPKKSVMWWAGKQFQADKPLNFYTGKNQKTKILVKLTKIGSGPPAREAGMDQQTKVKMMSMYHKKQEQLKKIESNNEDDFANSSWANPNNLKSYLVSGNEKIKWKSK